MTRILIGAFVALLGAAAFLPADGAAQSAAKPSSLFVAVGHKGARVSSVDGTNWKDLQTGKDGETYRAVAFGNGRFVAVGNYGGDNIVATTIDGITWKTGKKEAKYVNFFRGLVFANGTFYGIGGDPGAVGSSRPFLSASTDGETWDNYREISGKNMLRRIAYGNGLYVGVGDRGRRAASPDTKDWKDVPDVKSIDTLVDIAYGNGVFVGVGLHSLRMTTTDGLKWTDRLIGEEGEHLNSVVWAGNRFVAVGIGATYISPDGVTWQRQANQDGPVTVAYGNGVFIGAKWRGRIMRSTDAIHWTQVYQCDHHIEAVAFGGS